MLTFSHTERDPLTGAMFSTSHKIRFYEVYEGHYMSDRQHNGDWTYYWHLDVTDMESACGDVSGGRWLVSLNAVSVGAAGNAELANALSSAGLIEDGELFYTAMRRLKKSWGKEFDRIIHFELSQYGVHACLFHKLGNNCGKLMQEAKKQAVTISGLFGFYMDRQQNMIGSTGWDFIKGDTMAGLARRERAHV